MIVGKLGHLVEKTFPPHGEDVLMWEFSSELQSYCEATVLITVPSRRHLEVIKTLVGKCSFQRYHFRLGLIHDPCDAFFCVCNLLSHHF